MTLILTQSKYIFNYEKIRFMRAFVLLLFTHTWKYQQSKIKTVLINLVQRTEEIGTLRNIKETSDQNLREWGQ